MNNGSSTEDALRMSSMTSIKILCIVSLMAIFGSTMMSAANVAAKDSRDIDSQLRDKIAGNQGGHQEWRDNHRHRGNYNHRRDYHDHERGYYNYGSRYDDRGRRYYPTPPPTVLIPPPVFLFPFWGR
jgi:Ni/Co efflux regulator RcnB